MSGQQKRVNENKTVGAALNLGHELLNGLLLSETRPPFYHHFDIRNQVFQTPDYVHLVHSVHFKIENNTDSDKEPVDNAAVKTGRETIKQSL